MFTGFSVRGGYIAKYSNTSKAIYGSSGHPTVVYIKRTAIVRTSSHRMQPSAKESHFTLLCVEITFQLLHVFDLLRRPSHCDAAEKSTAMAPAAAPFAGEVSTAEPFPGEVYAAIPFTRWVKGVVVPNPVHASCRVGAGTSLGLSASDTACDKCTSEWITSRTVVPSGQTAKNMAGTAAGCSAVLHQLENYVFLAKSETSVFP